MRYLLMLEGEPDLILVEDEMPGTFAHMIRYGWDQYEQCPIYAPEGTPLPKDKFDKNLNHKRKVEFESALAISIFENSDLVLPVLHKLGNLICEDFKAKAKNDPEFENRVGSIFYDYFSDEDYLGASGSQKLSTSYDAYEKAMDILTTGTDLAEVMYVLGRVFNVLTKEDKDFTTLAIRTKAPLRSERERGRVRVKNKYETHATSGAGIEEKPTFDFVLGHHSRTLDRTTRNHVEVADFAFNAYQKEIPFVSGPSGSTLELLTIFNYYTKYTFSSEELHLFMMAIAGFFIAAGSHSFHEIYALTEVHGVVYDEGIYEPSLPVVFKETDAYKKLLEDYDDIIFSDLKILDEIEDILNGDFEFDADDSSPTTHEDSKADDIDKRSTADIIKFLDGLANFKLTKDGDLVSSDNDEDQKFDGTMMMPPDVMPSTPRWFCSSPKRQLAEVFEEDDLAPNVVNNKAVANDDYFDNFNPQPISSKYFK